MSTNSKEYGRAYYLKNRTKLIAIQNEKNKAMKKRLRQWSNEIKTNAGCKVCKEIDPVVLSFHHRDPKTKLFDVATGISQCLSKKRLLREIEKCDVLCLNDHAREEDRKRNTAKEVKHETM